ncbi:MAG: FAD-binding protein [Desulfocucumaceae bacterium]
MDFIETINTGVLVVGGGGAGLCAALSARKEGAEVLLTAKSRSGRACNTAVSKGTFAVATGAADDRNTADLHFRDTMVSGRWINRPGLVRTMVDGAREQLNNLQDYQVPLRRNGDGKLRIHSAPGHSVARHVTTERRFGTDCTLPLLAHTEKLGVAIASGLFVERLCIGDEGRIAGAVAIDTVRQGLVAIQARAVVLAGGGAGQVYSRTNNAPGTTGDGYALGFRAGIPMVDMEFVQFYPTYVLEQSFMGIMASYEILVSGGGAVLRNSLGEDIIRLHGHHPTSVTRDALTLAIAREIRQGRGVKGGIWMDLSTIPNDKLDLYHRFIPRRLWGRQGFVVSPVAHHFMGGLRVGDRGETGIEGLFSAGEVNGGVHGANRLAGNALTEAWVFGEVTGRLAAQFSSRKGRGIAIKNLDRAAAEIKSRTGGRGPFPVEGVRRDVQRLMWEKAGIIRTRDGLAELAGDFARMRSDLSAARTGGWKELISKLETENMLLAGEAVVRSALLREESRGAHYRMDFPDEGGDHWARNVMVTIGQDGRISAELLKKGLHL